MAAEDIVVIAVVLMLAGVGVFIVGYVGSTAATSIAAQPVVNESSYAVTAFNALDSATQRFDILFLAVFIGLTLGLIILSWFVPTHPIFYIAYFLVIIVAVIVSAIMANVWELVANHSALVAMLLQFPITNHVLTNLPIYIAVIGFTGITTMFAKPYIMGETG